MPDDLRFCASGCCHFVNNQAVSRRDYELVAQAYGPSVDLCGSVEIMIPCRKSAGSIQYETENSVGFYLGVHLPRTTGIPLLKDTIRSVFDKATGDFLRVATDVDLRRWNAARRQAIKAAKSISDRTPSLLQIPLGQPKS